jgi:DNA-binding response OmpR family regulator
MKTAPKIVVLEDDRASKALITLYLERAGYHVFPAGEGRYAIELVMKERPVLLIADVMIPDLNGSEVVKQLLATSFGCKLNALFLTSLLSKNGAKDEETKLKVDGKEFPALSKPFKGPVLLNIVNRIVEDSMKAEEASIAAAKAKKVAEANAAVEKAQKSEAAAEVETSVKAQTEAAKEALAEEPAETSAAEG